MRRISSYMPNDNMQYHLRNREFRMNELSEKMASQERIKELRDDPLGAGRATRFDTSVRRMQRFDKNIGIVRGELAETEGYLREAVDVLHRINELGVQGANGIYSQEQLSYMAEEVDQLLHELIQVANGKTSEGNSVFAGLDVRSDAFRGRVGPVDGAGVEKITSVDYIGNIGVNQAEVDRGAFMEVNMPGNHAFWAENQQVYTSQDATTYRVQTDSTMRIDGVPIKLQPGDNVAAIAARINDSAAPVRARLDPVDNALVLESTRPHQIWLEDLEGSVLGDMGVLDDRGGRPPVNLTPTTRVFGGSVFDMVIHLRDRLYAGDTAAIGGSGLRGIQQSIESMSTALADVGARDSRLQLVAGRLAYQTTEVTGSLSRELDLDLSEAVTDLKMLEYTHKAALATAARVMKPTLLDFLR